MYKNYRLCSGRRAVTAIEVLYGVSNLCFGQIEIKREYLVKNLHSPPRAESRMLLCFLAPDAVVLNVNDASTLVFPNADFQVPA